MDFNNLVTPMSALTNCLNGTSITYNGNEFVLQNDMGNGRVETAYLPTGYVPVGVKEYGGVVYIASVNPTTQECQIGSFPSPERNIGTKDTDSTESQSLLPDKLAPGTLVYKTKAFGDIEISVGDKFALQLDMSVEDASKVIDACFNTVEIGNITKISSPKKKTWTIQLMVEDAEHNLRDVTNTLKRYGLYNWEQPLTDTVQDQAGYYFQFTNSAKPVPNNQGDSNQQGTDQAMVENEMPYAQDYAGRVSGKLYLVFTLNSISEYEVSWINLENEKVEKGKLYPMLDFNSGTSPIDIGNLGNEEEEDPGAIQPANILRSPSFRSTTPVMDVEVKFPSNNQEVVNSFYVIYYIKNNRNVALDEWFGVTINSSIKIEDGDLVNCTNIEGINRLNLYSDYTGWYKEAYYIKNQVNIYETPFQTVIYYFPLKDPQLANKLYNVSIEYVKINSFITDGTENYQEEDGTTGTAYCGEIYTSRTIQPASINLPTTQQKPTDIEFGTYINNGKTYPKFKIAEVTAANREVYLHRVNQSTLTSNFLQITEDNLQPIGDSYAYVTEENLIPQNWNSAQSIIIFDCLYFEDLVTTLDTVPYIIRNTQDFSDPIEWVLEEPPLPAPTFTFVDSNDVELTMQYGRFIGSSGIVDVNDISVKVIAARPNLDVVFKIYKNAEELESLQKIQTTDNNCTTIFTLNNLHLTEGFYTIRIGNDGGAYASPSEQFIILPTDDYDEVYIPKGTLQIDYYYNCPDGYTESALPEQFDYPNNWNDLQNTYNTYYGNDVYVDNNVTKSRQSIIGSNIIFSGITPSGKKLDVYSTYQSISKNFYEKDNWPVYDPITKLYHHSQQISFDFGKVFGYNRSGSQNQLTAYKKTFSLKDLPILTYTITPEMNYEVGELSNFSQTGVIDFGKVGSGEISIYRWKYQYDQEANLITIAWGLENYLRSNQQISNLKFDFFKISSDANFSVPNFTYYVESRTSYNGLFTEILSTEDLEENYMYLVKISCILTDSADHSVSTKIIGYRWLLTTALYNDLYSDTDVKDLSERFDNDTVFKVNLARTVTIDLIPSISQVTSGSTTIKCKDSENHEWDGTYNVYDEGDQFAGTHFIANIATNIESTCTLNCEIKITTTNFPVKETADYDLGIPFISNIEVEDYNNCITLGANNTFSFDLNQSITFDGEVLTGEGTFKTYQCYADYLKSVSEQNYDTLPCITVYGFTQSSNNYAKLHLDYKEDSTALFGADDQGNKLNNKTESFSEFIKSNSRIRENVYDKLQNQCFPHILSDQVSNIECYRLDWKQGVASKHNDHTYDGYPTQYIYFIRYDLDKTENSGAARFISALSSVTTKKCDTYQEVISTFLPDVARTLVEKDDDPIVKINYIKPSATTAFSKSRDLTPKATISQTIQDISFVTEDGFDYNKCVRDCKELASQLYPELETIYSYLWEQMEILIPKSEVFNKTIDLESIHITGGEVLDNGFNDTTNVILYTPLNSTGYCLAKIQDQAATYMYTEEGDVQEITNVTCLVRDSNQVKVVRPHQKGPSLIYDAGRSYKDSSVYKDSIAGCIYVRRKDSSRTLRLGDIRS